MTDFDLENSNSVRLARTAGTRVAFALVSALRHSLLPRYIGLQTPRHARDDDRMCFPKHEAPCTKHEKSA